MLKTSHLGLEAMSAACSALKDERWTDAQKRLTEVAQLVQQLQNDVGERQRAAMMVPEPDKGDRE
jgi:hypothetical protein